MIQDLFDLEGRVAIVTAASRGIGAGIAKAFAEAGADVVIGARNAEALSEVADAIAASGRRAQPVAGDLRTRDGMQALVQAAEAAFGRIDVVVNNAGGSMPSAFLETSEQAFNASFTWNVTTAFNLTQLAVPRMLEGGGGSVINIASAAGRFAARGFVAYGTAKAAMIHMTRNLAEDLAPRIRVNAIAPGSIETDALAPVVENPAIRDEMLRRTPLGRLGRVEDIAAGALLLASDAGSYITGRVLDIDGGIHGSNLELGIGDV
jgi:7-alpha-hydroxysteroid dehydrogenase